MGKNMVRVFFLILTIISAYFTFIYEKIPENTEGLLIIITAILAILFLFSLFMPKALDQTFSYKETQKK